MGIDFELEGKRALVTGAGQGVGEGIARMLAAAGAEVVVNDYVPERAEAAAGRIREAGGAATALPFDVTDHGQVHERIGGAGPIDILVNNAGNAGVAGFGETAPFVDTTPDQWEPYLAVNLYGVMNCVHAALPGMVERGWGRVVTIVSDAGRTGGAGTAAYAAAKAGAAAFCRAVAQEVGRHGVTVNNVSLGTMRTPVTEDLWRDPDKEDLRKVILSGYVVRRPGEPADAAWIVTALASPRAGWVTGQTIPVNGGFSFAL
ncbi:MAG: SDR family NAD(P)-dependent oxidoreductase [Acidimicrobiia bacterium]